MKSMSTYIYKEPNGLYNKYVISRVDKKDINPDNVYFVLKLEGEGDAVHMEACRKAVLVYAKEIESHLPQLAADLRERYGNDQKQEEQQ